MFNLMLVNISHVLTKSYPGDLKSQSVFNIDSNIILQCVCGREYLKPEDQPYLKLYTENADNFTSVQSLLDQTLSENGIPNSDYQCRGDLTDQNIIPGLDPGCQKRGSCREFRNLEILGDFLIIVLQLFTYDDNFQPYKATPNITINHELTCFDTFELCGIVWHSGLTADSGHYVSSVKINGQWFLADDNKIEPGLKQYDPNSITKEAPYILLYRKNNVVPESLVSASQTYATSTLAIPNDQDNLNSMKRKKLAINTDSEPELIFENEGTDMEANNEIEKPEEDNKNSLTKKFNFSKKRKSQFSKEEERNKKK